MAGTETSEIVSFVTPPSYEVGAAEGGGEASTFITPPAYDAHGFKNANVFERTTYVDMSTVQFIEVNTVNKVWDSAVGGGSWVTWESTDVDYTGEFYPYPANWGVSTSFFRTQSVVYSRND